MSQNWSHIYGEGYICALPIANYQVGFVVVAKVGEVAEKLEYYPVITLEQNRVKIVVSEVDPEKATAVMRVVDNLLPKPQEAPKADEPQKKSRKRSAE